MRVHILIIIILFSTMSFSCEKNENGSTEEKETYYEKSVKFPSDLTWEQKVDMASRVVPTPQQLAWQKMELTAFLHFGVNTFTGNEWGDGKEDPNVFNPTELDAEQWVKSLKDAGFKMAIITAKHHDGFCLWPTETTSHSVASSAWKNGKGDVVRELKNACDKYGMKFGFYLSPWDRNTDCYGTSEYNSFFIRQLTELLTNYGPVQEVWFDGANGEGPNGKVQKYDWNTIRETVARLQPAAVTAIVGDDVRWVGNESGLGRETEWSATPFVPVIYNRSWTQNEALGIGIMGKDLGSRDIIQNATEMFWYPSEVDVSIRPGWFFHEEENSQVKSLNELVDIYFQSVGYNSVLLLNIPPDKRGLIHETDVQRLSEFSSYINNTFSSNFVKNGNESRRIAPGESVEYELTGSPLVNVLSIQEDISKGQRVESFTFEAWTNNKWTKIGEGTTVGYKRLLRIPPVQTSRIKVTITGARNNVNINQVGAYYALPLGN